MAVISFGFFVFLAFPVASYCYTCTDPNAPGFSSRITQIGVQSFREYGIKKLTEMVYSLEIPPQSGRSIKVSYKAWNLKVTNFEVPTSKLILQDDIGVKVMLSNISISITGKFWYRAFVTKHSGDLNINIKGMSTAFTVGIGETGGRPSLFCYDYLCDLDAGDVAVHLTPGPASHEADAEAYLKDTMNEKGCSEIVKKINGDVDENLSKLSMRYPIHQVLDFDFSFVSPPVITNQSLDIQHKGEVYLIDNHDEASLPKQTLPKDADMSRMFFAWVTDFVANSASYVLFQYDYLQYDITEKDVPPGSKLSLNTSAYPTNVWIPNVTQMFPGKVLEVGLKSTAPPTVTSTTSGVTVTASGNVTVYINNPSKPLQYLFTLSSQLTMLYKLGVNRGNVTWVANLVSINVNLIQTAIGPFKIDTLKKMLPKDFQTYIIPMINQRGAIGVTIPCSDDIKVVNTVIQHASGYLKFGTDFATNIK